MSGALRPASRFWRPIGLVQVVVHVVHLDIHARVGGLELGGDVIPDADAGLTRRAHRDAQRRVLGERAAGAAGRSAARAAAIAQRSGPRSGPGHRVSPSSSGTSPGRNIVPVRSDKVISNVSPNTRTRARRSLIRNGRSSAVPSVSSRPFGDEVRQPPQRLGAQLERHQPRPALRDQRRGSPPARAAGGPPPPAAGPRARPGPPRPRPHRPATTRNSAAPQHAAHDDRVLLVEARRAHVVREQRERLRVRLARRRRGSPAPSSPRGRSPRGRGGSRRSWRTGSSDDSNSSMPLAMMPVDAAPQVPVAVAVRPDVQLVAHRHVVHRVVVPVGGRPVRGAREDRDASARSSTGEQISRPVQNTSMRRSMPWPSAARYGSVPVPQYVVGQTISPTSRREGGEDLPDQRDVGVDQGREGRPILRRAGARVGMSSSSSPMLPGAERDDRRRSWPPGRPGPPASE